MRPSFNVPGDLPFLFYRRREEGAMYLVAETIPTSQPLSYDDLFETVDMSHFHGSETALNHTVISMANRIACETRRACGNIVIVPSHDNELWLRGSGDAFSRFQYFIDTSMQPNEVRVAYWHLHGNAGPVAVDGGIAISPEGFHCLPKYRDYFKRSFWY